MGDYLHHSIGNFTLFLSLTLTIKHRPRRACKHTHNGSKENG